MIQINENDLDEIFKLLDINNEIGIIGNTNTGKSTSFVYNLHIKNPDKIIFVVERTIIATTNLYRFIKLFFQNNKINTNNVGYAAENKIRYYNQYINEDNQSNTKIVYCIEKHFNNLMIKWLNGEIGRFCDYIILDECDVPILTYDTTMCGLMRLKEKKIEIPKLLLISATLDLNKTIFENIPTYELKSKAFDVEYFYHNKDFLITDRNIIKEIANVAIEQYDRIIKYKSGCTILIYCSGGRDVEQVFSEIEKITDNRLIELDKLYASLPSDHLKSITKLPNKNKIKIIVCTNIAESSLTLPNVIGVIDSIKRKIITISDSGEVELIEGYETKSSAKQRTGRAGRTQNGFCYRMCTQEGFENLENSESNEILRIPIDSLILSLINIGYNPYDFFKELIDKYEQIVINISNSLKNLIKLKLINEGSFNTTDIGKFSAKLPISLRYSLFLYKWIQYGNPVGLGIFFTCILNEYKKSFFEYIDDEDYNYVHSYFEHPLDLGRTLNIFYIFFEATFEKYTINTPEDIIIFFCDHYKLNKTMLLNVMKNIHSLHNILYDEYTLLYSLFNTDNALKKIIPILNEILYDKKFIKEGSSKNGINYRKIDSNDKYVFYKYGSRAQEEKQIIGLSTGEQTKNGISTKVIYILIPTSYKPEKKEKIQKLDDDF